MDIGQAIGEAIKEALEKRNEKEENMKPLFLMKDQPEIEECFADLKKFQKDMTVELDRIIARRGEIEKEYKLIKRKAWDKAADLMIAKGLLPEKHRFANQSLRDGVMYLTLEEDEDATSEPSKP